MYPFGTDMVIAIVLIVFGFKAFKYYLQHKESLMKKQPDFDIEALLTKFEDQKKINHSLEKRIQALETIVIQDDYELNRKFKEL